MPEVLLLRVDEAAQLIGCSRSFTYELVQTGELPSVRLGTTIRVPRSAIDAFIDAKLRDSGHAVHLDGRRER